MDFLGGFSTIGSVLFFGAVVAFVVQIIKKIFQMFSWSIYIPKQTWPALASVFGICIAIALNYDVTEQAIGATGVMPDSTLLSQVITGVGIGTASKVTHDVVAPVGAYSKKTQNKFLNMLLDINAPDTTEAVPTPVPTPEIQPGEEKTDPPEPEPQEQILSATDITEEYPEFIHLDDTLYRRV